jgi:predicted ATPase
MVGATFVGRQGELERLGRMLRGDPGAASAAVVTGDAGIGKTRLLREAVRAAPEVKVLVGACLPLSESLPYGAVTDALAVLSSPENRPALDQALVRCAPFVRRQAAALIPALDVEPRDIADAAVDRTRLFAALRDLLGALGAEQRTALVIRGPALGRRRDAGPAHLPRPRSATGDCADRQHPARRAPIRSPDSGLAGRRRPDPGGSRPWR